MRPSSSIRRRDLLRGPEELADELFDKLTEYYADDPNVTVIVDRRKTSRRKAGQLGRGATAASATAGGRGSPASSPSWRPIEPAPTGTGGH